MGCHLKLPSLKFGEDWEQLLRDEAPELQSREAAQNFKVPGSGKKHSCWEDKGEDDDIYMTLTSNGCHCMAQKPVDVATLGG